MDRIVRARVLLAEAATLGVTLDDLVAASADIRGPMLDVPTVAEYVDTVDKAIGGRTAETYRSYWRLLVARYGDRPIDGISHDDCRQVVDDAIAKAQRSRPGSDGRASQAHCVTALRALFARAERAGLISRNPSAALDKRPRLKSRRRSLDDTELTELVDAVRTTSYDPDLDLLLVRFHLESGARRVGALSLRLGDLDHRRATVLLQEKYAKEREQPVSPSLVAALDMFARSRGASAATDAVFRTKRNRPIVRKHYNTLFDRVQAALPWTRRTPATAHVLRRTAGTAVERIAGHAVANGFLGHAPDTITGVYTEARIEEIAAAVAVLTGEPHPLGA